MINKFSFTKRAHISRRKFDTIFDCFVADISATKVAKISYVNRNTTNRCFDIFREIIFTSAVKERRVINLQYGIESWAKQRLSMYNSMAKEQFSRYLIEPEWRYNDREKLRSDMRKILLNF